MCIMLKMIACDGVCLLYMDHIEPLPIWVITFVHFGGGGGLVVLAI